MKNYFLFFAIFCVAVRIPAQTNPPVKFALISETDEALPAADLLTAKFSGNDQIQLLERDQIEKVYREQGLSAANTDYLKLGHILGADGLLLLNIVRTPQTTNLMARLIAVKPGVVLSDASFGWPPNDTAQWSDSAATYLNSFLPKLTVLLKDAIPISIVNLRSAINSTDAAETERQLKLLVIQRLSQERQLFVLERQKMQLLSDEKELKADDSAFWDGSYLLEGVVDQNGYSPDMITINARLTPPRGGAPVLFVVRGSRTNLTEVINQLAVKVNDALKIKSTAPAWNAADEAAQFFKEAQWALHWGVYGEAQSAADSAWALGKKDMDCAQLRIHAYMVSPDAGQSVIFYPPQKSPDLHNITSVLHALRLYNEMSRNLPPDEPKVDSDWYRLGLDDLAVASRVLQVFNWSSDYYQPAAEKLSELRAAARSTSDWISKSPSVHDSYYVGNRVVVYDDLYHFEEKPSIFSVQLDCGCLWQDKPEDCLAIYRQLMSSPVFCYLHEQFWLRDAHQNSVLTVLPPHLVAWNETDQKNLPVLWNKFKQELNDSTNLLLRLEAKALCLAAATNETDMAGAFTNFFDTIFDNSDALVANPVEVLYLDWHVGDLVERMGGDTVLQNKEALRQLYLSQYSPKLRALDQAYRDKTVPAWKTAQAFEAQKRYLADFTPYDFQTFQQMFSVNNYTKTQAAELEPLIIAYKSNLVAQASADKKFFAQSDAQWIELSLEKPVNNILNSPAPQPVSPKIQTSRPVTVVKSVAPAPVTTNASENATNVIAVTKFLPIPLDTLMRLSGLETLNSSTVTITAHQWLEGKLLLNFDYTLVDNKYGGTDGSAIAILDPAMEHWEIVSCPKEEIESQNHFHYRSTFLHGELFTCAAGRIQRYDFKNQQWQALSISDGKNYELFAVNGKLYAADKNVILEIIDGGKSTRLLASNRRQPAISVLDTEDLGIPMLFTGPDHSLQVSAKNKIFTWINDDWSEVCAAPSASFAPAIFPNAVLFQSDGWNVQPAQVSLFSEKSNRVELCLEKPTRPAGQPKAANPVAPSDPLWKLPPELSLPNLSASVWQSDLYLVADQSDIVDAQQHLITGKKNVAQGGYNTILFCFTHGLPLPQKIFLNFDTSLGCPPAAGAGSDSRPMIRGMGLAEPWILFTTNFLICGRERLESPAGNSEPTGYKSGIWLIPRVQLDAAMADQKQIQLAEQTQASAIAEQTQKNLLAKYDLNHNGLIDPDEKEAALDDPAFIAWQLDEIDTNCNERLDLEELAYFDANKNKTLEPKEQAGIEIAQHLLAERELKKFDADGDSLLNKKEFQDLLLAIDLKNDGNLGPAIFDGHSYSYIKCDQIFRNADDNHDGMIDLSELESYLKQPLRQKVRPRGARGRAFFQAQMQSGHMGNPKQLFKAELEAYWQNPGNITDQPPVN